MEKPEVDIEALAELARIAIPRGEKESLKQEVPAILSFVETIRTVSAAVSQSAPVPGAHRNVMRDDMVGHASGEYTEALLSAAPAREGVYVKVKQVITGGKHTGE